jgi:prophage antirepressor-like protein
MNELQIFNSPEFGDIRIVMVESEPMFCLSDVCRALEITNVGNVKQRLSEKGIRTMDTLTKGGNQKLLYINEANLYKTIFQSRKESAQRFTDWVTDEVLPSIRKHGAYMTEQVIEKALTSPDFLIRLATQLKEEQEKRKLAESEVKMKNQIISELKPKADYYDEILKNPGLVTITQIAKDYGMSGKKMNDILHSLGIQYKKSGQWLLYDRYSKNGYTHSETVDITRSDGRPDVKMNTKWTQKGRIFLYSTLKEKDILPVIEMLDETA